MFSNNCSLGSVSGTSPPNFPNRTDVTLESMSVTPLLVSRMIAKLDSNISPGPDCIPSVILKILSPELSSILAKLFNKCLKECTFPNTWRCATIVPAFKNCGDRTDPNKYRPISLLPIISKIFESIINNKISGHLESLCLLTDKQYGFRRSRSTADLLTVITERIFRALDRCGETKSVALDISKAFDRVWHQGLLQKIQSYGISGQVFSVVKSFLSNRKINVVLDGQRSGNYSISSGVPQGSILGPTLFLIYINALPDNLICDLVIYADDTTLYSCLNDESLPEQRLALAKSLECDLATVSNWGNTWQVTLGEN